MIPVSPHSLKCFYIILIVKPKTHIFLSTISQYDCEFEVSVHVL